MTQELSDYWANLDGTVHPDDAAEFEKFPEHGFNLDFPPPAFIGDIVNAPVLILENNGGYAESTRSEFPDMKAHTEFRDLLSNPRPVDRRERTISPYYLQRNYTRWLEDGVAALVNGVAYRSVDGKARDVETMSRTLPSALKHQHWLRNVVLPMARSGERFIVVHRWTRWNSAANVLKGCDNAIFSPAPVSKDLSKAEIHAATTFLERRI